MNTTRRILIAIFITQSHSWQNTYSQYMSGLSQIPITRVLCNRFSSYACSLHYAGKILLPAIRIDEKETQERCQEVEKRETENWVA